MVCQFVCFLFGMTIHGWIELYGAIEEAKEYSPELNCADLTLQNINEKD
ncbi:MAG: hypothetical protein AAFQ41_01380 [Cyanobacteria bacterium J06623_7]